MSVSPDPETVLQKVQFLPPVLLPAPLHSLVLSPAVQEFPIPEVSHFPVSYPLFLLLFLQPAL